MLLLLIKFIMNFNTYTTRDGQKLLYIGNPNMSMLDELSTGQGDCWHSSFEQGYKNAFQELSYQTHVSWWYINDFDNLDTCISWRINPHAFVVRKYIWDLFGGFDSEFKSDEMRGLSFGYAMIRQGAVPLYVKGLFSQVDPSFNQIPIIDHYLFFRKKFKWEHAGYMLLRNLLNPSHWFAYISARKYTSREQSLPFVTAKPLQPVQGKPTVSYIIPTMMRQHFTVQLLGDLAAQTYPPTQVIIVDATPEAERIPDIYLQQVYPFTLEVYWQSSKGSCRARNEGIEKCTGEYIIFGDDDLRLAHDFIEMHLRFLQTYEAEACNGLDIRADHQQQDLRDLKNKIEKGEHEPYVRLTNNFNNANSCVKKEIVDSLIGNDVNYDGGYGEDSDFGISLTKAGISVFYNPFAASLHLKPSAGGYRWWGSQSKILGKKRKSQPWELGVPVKWVRPVPSPTIMYQLYKHYNAIQQREYHYKYLLMYLIKGSKAGFFLRLLMFPIKWLQYRKSQFYAKRLIAQGVKYA